MDSGEVLEWFVSVGDEVKAGQPLVEVGTYKADIEVESPVAGVLLAALEPGARRALRPHLQVLELRRGTVLLEAGQEAAHVWFPHAGAALALVARLEDGATATGMVGREGVVDLAAALGDRRALGRAVVLVAGAFSRIGHAPFRAAFETRPAVRQLCLRYNEALVAQLLQSAACHALHPVEARLCRWLLGTQDRVGRADLPLTHELLAEMLGVNRSTVTLAALDLQRMGLVEQRRGAVRVRDRAGLEAASCACHGLVRRRFERLLPGSFG
jgi:CRP-like cAMP-binding protein